MIDKSINHLRILLLSAEEDETGSRRYFATFADFLQAKSRRLMVIRSLISDAPAHVDHL